MTSLYQRLFQYRERAERSPLEDYLSEALADLLNRLPEQAARDAVALLIGGRIEALRTLDRLWPDWGKGRWTTQHGIGAGRRIDLLLEVNGTPVAVVESKIGAGFQEHRVNETEGEAGHQLATYGRWLSQTTEREWGGALILLTHWTPAPDDFLLNETRYGCSHRSVLRWSDLARWLTDAIRHDTSSGGSWTTLAAEFTTFLKEHDMDSELATTQDLAALQIYLASADRVRNTVERIWEASRVLWRPLCQKTEYPIDLSSAYGCVWKYRYLARDDLRSCYLAVGIRYPRLSDHADYADPQGDPYLFVELGSDEEDSPINSLQLGGAWAVSGDQRIAALPLRELPSDADRLLSEAERWTGLRISEVADRIG